MKRSSNLSGGKNGSDEAGREPHRSIPGPGLVPAAVIFALLAAITSGCASWRQRITEGGISETREERAAAVVREFEDRRDAAQLAAALERFNQGDTDRAEAMLTAIVNRRPDCTEARVPLAEILWSKGDPSAERHLRDVLDREDSNAEAHHTLGLLLAASDRSSEARQHLERASQLAPDNEVYRETVESLPPGP